jgi:hypothetical protein
MPEAATSVATWSTEVNYSPIRMSGGGGVFLGETLRGKSYSEEYKVFKFGIYTVVLLKIQEMWQVDPEYDTVANPRKVSKYLPVDTAYHPRGFKFIKKFKIFMF